MNSLDSLLLAAIRDHTRSSTELARLSGVSPATVKRALERLVDSGQAMRTGKARATRYLGMSAGAALVSHRAAEPEPAPYVQPPWSRQSLALRRKLDKPLASRDPVTYQRSFVDAYVPNESSLLPAALAAELAQAGRMKGQQPAGTYARKVLEQLLIDLSWSSSRLEGNRYSLLATLELFRTGLANGDADAVMLLNHKRAIEFMVDAVPEYGLNTPLIRNIHAVLLQDLLADADALGTIRRKVVNISDTTYVPTQVPSLLEEMLALIVDKARLAKNPVEAAFFLWVNLAYLQPFEDGNKRTSRLAANVPLMLYNCAPLSFNDVDARDYAMAMMGVYERLDVSMATDLFAWTYRRSMQKYVVVLEAMGAPDPVRLRYRESLNDAIQLIVRERRTALEAMAALRLDESSAPGFRGLLEDELAKLGSHNCGRYRLGLVTTDEWVAAGRPH